MDCTMRVESRDSQHVPVFRAQHMGLSREASQPLRQHWHSVRMRLMKSRTSWALSLPSRFLPRLGMRWRRTTLS
ncbi:hypothetical protein SAMN05421874_1229 [Nonomuraea maritima]|uniref:Uncharacterized protein n=1 Tax=Nonomuraea maritima TaxID=683260 RepID=A0A1G9K8G9_9ACTN|nr:hypothetical protein SAMN05421874_1229 [Nonomuraea maritima]